MQSSPHFVPITISNYNYSTEELTIENCSEKVVANKEKFLKGENVLWGIPFVFGPETGNNIIYTDKSGESGDSGDSGDSGNEAFVLGFEPVSARYLVFVHGAEMPLPEPDRYGLFKHLKGDPPLGAKVCDYVVKFTDGTEETVPIRCRFEINNMDHQWWQNSFLSVAHDRYTSHETATTDFRAGILPVDDWGETLYRVGKSKASPEHWLYAWENPHPEMEIVSIEIRPDQGKIFLLGLTAGQVKEHPLRYSGRQKTVLKLEGDSARPLSLIDIDLGQIISVVPRPKYDNDSWEHGYNNQQPALKKGEYIVEYAAHEDAVMYLGEERKPLPVRDLSKTELVRVMPAQQPVTLRVIGPGGKTVPVKVHAHGTGGEYLPPRHRQRIPNPYWFEDYSVDFVHGPHWCTYIDGSAEYLLPKGEVFFEVSKGFEIKPVRKRFEITHETESIEIQLEKVLDWRSLGWVTADTHVHFLSPNSALLEGEAEGVNVVNLLAAQWGELITNIGDFDGKSLLTSGDEYMVRVGTENRQKVLGHISLLGYEGKMILPLSSGGPDEAALGDPVEITLSEWARKCREQKGLNIIPHFPFPRGESAAAIVSDLIDGVEMTSWDDLYSGISPYSLSDWYRYLNCGYHAAAVGGTDKMSSDTAIGTVRTYAFVPGPLTYESWKDAIRSGCTFVSYGALVDMKVEGRRQGSCIQLNGPATLQIEWEVASATIPVTAVELVIGGDTVDVTKLDGFLGSRSGSFTAKVEGSTWIALRVRGHQPGKKEIITAHTSAVMVSIEGKIPMSASDAVTILEQIEGVTAYVTSLGTKAKDRQFKEILSSLTSAHRSLHNRLHEMGYYHKHTAVDEHHH